MIASITELVIFLVKFAGIFISEQHLAYLAYRVKFSWRQK